jgi:hypothetical protein
MADDPRPEDRDTANEPARTEAGEPRVDERGKSPDEELPAEVIDDDRFQATDN